MSVNRHWVAWALRQGMQAVAGFGGAQRALRPAATAAARWHNRAHAPETQHRSRTAPRTTRLCISRVPARMRARSNTENAPLASAPSECTMCESSAYSCTSTSRELPAGEGQGAERRGGGRDERPGGSRVRAEKCRCEAAMQGAGSRRTDAAAAAAAGTAQRAQRKAARRPALRTHAHAPVAVELALGGALGGAQPRRGDRHLNVAHRHAVALRAGRRAGR